jgi:hypothetical protein
LAFDAWIVDLRGAPSRFIGLKERPLRLMFAEDRRRADPSAHACVHDRHRYASGLNAPAPQHEFPSAIARCDDPEADRARKLSFAPTGSQPAGPDGTLS